jgi:replicative DNA helicase
MQSQASYEGYVLGASLGRKDYWVTLGIKPNDFVDPGYKQTWTIALELLNQGTIPDALSLGDELAKRGFETPDAMELLSLQNSTAGMSELLVRQDAGRLLEASARRHTEAVLADALTRIQRGMDEPREVAEDTRMRLAAISQPTSSATRRVGDGIDEVIKDIEDRRAGKAVNGVPTGIRTLDAELGPMRPGQLIVIAARPGIGKTSLARSFALGASAKDIPVLLFSLEMTFAEQTQALMSAVTKVPAMAMSTAIITDAEMDKLRRYTGPLRSAPIDVNDAMLSADQIVAEARVWRARQTAPIALIMVDYLGLIRADKREDTRALEVGRMTWAMKALAKDIACPVILVSQLNRLSEREGREPTLSDLRDSGSIEQDANVVVFPERMPPLSDSGPASLIIAKNRSGRTGRVACYWNAPTMSFQGI